VSDDVPQHSSPDDAARWNRRERVRLAGLAAAAVAGVYLIAGTVAVDIPSSSALAGGRSAPAAPVRLSPSRAVPRRTQQPHVSSRPRHGQRVDRAAHGRFENGGRGRVIGSATTEQGETSPRPSSPAAPKPASPAPTGVVAAPSPPSPTPPAAPAQPPQVPSLTTPPSLPAPPPFPLPVPDPPSVPVPSVPPLSPPALPVP
jgi:hypothetical protein